MHAGDNVHVVELWCMVVKLGSVKYGENSVVFLAHLGQMIWHSRITS